MQGELTGVEAAVRIRKRRDVPVVYITAHTGLIENAANPRGNFLYLAKPFVSGENKILEIA
ncbi:MAG: hypothetical protein ACR2IV_19690 [Bryobacteraceae bacterium]